VKPQPKLLLVVQRRIDNVSSGNGAYLKTFLQTARQAGLGVHVAFAPRRSFGNLPWAAVHPHFDALSDSLLWPGSIRLGRYFLSTSPAVWWRSVVRLGRELLRRSGVEVKVYSYLGNPLDDREAAAIAGACRGRGHDIVVVEYSSLAPLLLRLEARPVKGVLMHDLLADRGCRFRESEREPDFLEISRELEASWVSAADFCLFASAAERAAFAPYVRRTRCLWLPPQPRRYRPQASGGPRIVYIGSRHAGNEDALNHFIDDVWPKVAAAAPETELWIAGAIGGALSRERKGKRGVKTFGRVEDLSSLGGADSIGVAPARLATGVSIKVAEYLMLRMPCVAYRRALEGFGNALDGLVVVANSSGELAERIVALLRDPDERARLSAAGGEARERLSNRAVVAFLRGLVEPKPRRTDAVTRLPHALAPRVRGASSRLAGREAQRRVARAHADQPVERNVPGQPDYNHRDGRSLHAEIVAEQRHESRERDARELEHAVGGVLELENRHEQHHWPENGHDDRNRA
jgi:glycosyltransferase involved in cell wall biosynthesis